jgi:DNA invertase Pin-like site-specific DNA recombinase
MIRDVLVRTSRQALSLERQTLALQAEAERVELDIVKDNGASGTLQPSGARACATRSTCSHAAGRRLIVAKLDRLGRNAVDVTALV